MSWRMAKRQLGSASAILFRSGFSLYGAMLLLPLYYQEVRGATALAAEVMLLSLRLPGAQLNPEAEQNSAAGQSADPVGVK